MRGVGRWREDRLDAHHQQLPCTKSIKEMEWIVRNDEGVVGGAVGSSSCRGVVSGKEGGIGVVRDGRVREYSMVRGEIEG